MALDKFSSNQRYKQFIYQRAKAFLAQLLYGVDSLRRSRPQVVLLRAIQQHKFP